MPKQYYQEYSTRPTRGFHFHLLARGSTNPKRDDTTGFVREDCPPYARRPPGDLDRVLQPALSGSCFYL